MSDWVGELSGLIKAWLAASTERNISVLHRKICKNQEISYGTVKHAANGDHEVNLSIALAILKIVLPTKEGRKAFVEKHHAEYLEFAKEFFEDEEIKDRPPSLSELEALVLAKLAKRCSLKIEFAKFFLGEVLYSNFLSWLQHYKLGKEDADMLVTTGQWVEIEDFQTTKKMITTAIDGMDPRIQNGNLIESVLGMTTKDGATQCWHIQLEAWKKCAEIVKKNPGDHEILLANIMKYD